MAVPKPAAARPAAARPAAARAGRPQAAAPGAGGGLLARRGVSEKVLTDFSQQLATLVNAGLPLVRCLRVLEGQLKGGPFREVLGAVADDVESGSTLSDALAKYPQVFDRLYVNMVRAGEAGGVLGTILQRLADFARRSERIKAQLKSALVYPAVVLTFAALIILIVLLFVVPKFEEILANFNVAMPLPTQIVIGLSRALGRFWYLVVTLPVLAWVGWRFALRSESFARRVDAAMLGVPKLGDVVRKTIVARFSRTLGTLLQSGVPILEALAIVRSSIQNRVLEEAVGHVHDSIREGESVAGPLGESGVFDDVVVNMIDVGEETGQLDAMLLRIADNFEFEVDIAVANFFKFLEPVLLVVMAVLVGGIVVSLFLPIVRIMQSMPAAG
ncbi:MAG: type II secretion system F family protein [Planctomycetes bacterium]|nr:type II secretion system F family protein [Planctomycetota bacterium]